MLALRRIKSNESLIGHGMAMNDTGRSRSMEDRERRDGFDAMNDTGRSRSMEDRERRDGFDVFLNFRGPDVRKDMADYIFETLKTYEVNVFRDEEEIRKGENIDSELVEGINKSKVAITIVSEGYAWSNACLQELAEIMNCRRTQGLKVLPVFYKVKTSELRKLNYNFRTALASHRHKYDAKTIETWKDALKEVSKLKGWTVNDNR